MRVDNDLLSAASAPLDYQQHQNAKRLRLWRLRWKMQFGKWPAMADVVPLIVPVTYPPRRPAHTNATVYKFPHHHRQYHAAQLPGPDAA